MKLFWAGGQLNPSEAFDELDKLIFLQNMDERKPRKMGEPYDFQIITVPKEEEKMKPKDVLLRTTIFYKRVMALYEEGRSQDKEVFRDNIRLTPEKIRTVVGYLESINLGETDLIVKDELLKHLWALFFRGTYGQYFTPREIVQFVVDVLPIQYDSKSSRHVMRKRGFSLYALNKVRTKSNSTLSQI